MITRRGLLQGIFAAGLAPAIVKAEILMPVRKIIVPSPIFTGEIGSLYGVRIVTIDEVIASNRKNAAADRTATGIEAKWQRDERFYAGQETCFFATTSLYEELLKGHA